MLNTLLQNSSTFHVFNISLEIVPIEGAEVRGDDGRTIVRNENSSTWCLRRWSDQGYMHWSLLPYSLLKGE